ncbi:TIGR03086 family metal-binding protein [Rothia koreensis]|uniref:TIGR03086 family metal-binding protein n=1 Tax=Rothia koreensis TaxID=592378 RepID=UPI003FCD5285
MLDLKPACCLMSDLLTAVTDDDLTSETPCTDFTLADLIEHVSSVSQGFRAVGEHRVESGNDEADPDMTNDTPSTLVAEAIKHVQALGAAWDDPTAWQGSTSAGELELSNDLWGRIALTEMVVHSWDIAQSLGRSISLPSETLQACLDHVTEFIPNAPVPELWGPPVDVTANASQIDRIVATTGRTP